MRHHAVGSHLVETACGEVEQFLILGFLHGIGASFQFVGHFLYAVHQRLHGFAARDLFVLAQDRSISTVCYVADGSNRLQLGSTFVDAGDTCVAVDALASIFHHEARTTVNLNTVVSVLVGIFRVHTFGQRCKGIGHLGVALLLLTFFGRQLAFAGDVIQGFVDVNITRSLVKQRATSVEFCLHGRQHVVYGRELDDGFAKLLAVLGVGQTFVVGCLAEADRLCGDTQTGTIHQRHYVFNQTQLAVTAKFGLGILINQFASG